MAPIKASPAPYEIRKRYTSHVCFSNDTEKKQITADFITNILVILKKQRSFLPNQAANSEKRVLSYKGRFIIYRDDQVGQLKITFPFFSYTHPDSF